MGICDLVLGVIVGAIVVRIVLWLYELAEQNWWSNKSTRGRQQKIAEEKDE